MSFQNVSELIWVFLEMEASCALDAMPCLPDS
jgi:hypothetical protein